MKQEPFDHEHAKIFQAISRGSYSFALALSGVIIACITALPDACEHHNLISVLSTVIIKSAISALFFLLLGIYLSAVSIDITEDPKQHVPWKDKLKRIFSIKFFQVTIPAVVVAAIAITYGVDAFGAAGNLPFKPSDAVAFCAKPEGT